MKYVSIRVGFDNYLYQGLYYLIASYSALMFVGVPSGIGIREYLFAYFLNNESLFYDAILVASLSRILTVINDFGLTAILSIMNKIKN